MNVLVYMNPSSRVPAAEKEFHVEATLTAAGHKAKVVESGAEVQKALDTGKYDLVLADVADVPELRKQCGASASKPAVLPLLYKPTAAELSAAEKEANCLVRPSKKSSPSWRWPVARSAQALPRPSSSLRESPD